MPFCKQKLLPSAVGYSSSSVPAAVIAIELDFVDSSKYNIAAYRLAELLNLDDTLPVYGERKWQGKTVPSAGGSQPRWTTPNASKKASLLIPINGISACAASGLRRSGPGYRPQPHQGTDWRRLDSLELSSAKKAKRKSTTNPALGCPLSAKGTS